MISRSCLILLLALVFGGCAATPQWNSEMPYPPDQEPKVGDVLHIPTGLYVSETQMLENAVLDPLVYVGEIHDNPASHRLQLAVLQAMAARYPGLVAMGMEMFTAKQQDVLDRWITGALTEKEFLRESRWFSDGWGSDFAYYRDLLVFCRDNNIAIIGLNIDKELGARVSMAPLAELEPELREQMPEMDLTDPYQRAMVEAMIKDHAAGSTMVDRFHRRQTVWDETMAQSIAEYMHGHPDMHMLVVAGGWHVDYGFGIPRRVFRRLPLAYTIIGSRTLKVPEEKQQELMHVTMPKFPMVQADYLVYQEYELLKKKGVRLGVLLDDQDEGDGVRVLEVMPGSVAELAGIAREERILIFDGVTVEDNFDVIYAVKNKSPGDTGQLVIRSGAGEERTVAVTFEANRNTHHPR